VTEPRTHDYAKLRCWGHDFMIRAVKKDGKRIEGSLWTPERFEVGDWLILPNGEHSTRYRVTKAEGTSVWDMHHYEAKFAPRKESR
jgi:hypothetical protein